MESGKNSPNGVCKTVDAERSDASSSSETTDGRGNWSRSTEFFLSCLGYAVGYGNLWRFPYLCYRNGGGAFLIPYFLFLFLAGLPMVFLEMALGQYSGKATFGCWTFCPIFKGLGMAMVMVSLYWCMFYNVIIMWTLYYLFHTFTKVLPWSTCGNPWNTEDCRPLGFVRNTSMCDAAAAGSNMSNLNLTTHCSNETIRYPYPAEEFWDNKMLNRSGGITEPVELRWDLALILVFAWMIVFLCLIKGIKSSGKVVYVTATAPYILITILLVQGVTREGSIDGIIYYIKPDFARLADAKVWAEACTQIFYSLAPGWGGLITMASYNKFHTNIYKYAIAVPLFNCGTSFYTGFVIFSVLGYMAKEAGVPVEEVVKSGPGLMFVAYPYALSKMPVPQLWCVLFFIMLLTVGLDSQFASVETFTTSVADEFPHLFTTRLRKMLFTALVCTVLCVLGFPCCTHGGIYVFQLMDWYVAVFTIMFVTLIEAIIVAWVYGADRFLSDIKLMTGHRPTVVWKYMWQFVTPATLLSMLVYSLASYEAPIYNGVIVYPSAAIGLAWLYGISSSIPIPTYAAYLLFYKTRNEPLSLWHRLLKYTRPTPEWEQRKDTEAQLSNGTNESAEAESLLMLEVPEISVTGDSSADDKFI